MKREPSAIESKHCAAVSRAADCRVQRTSFYFEGFFFFGPAFLPLRSISSNHHLPLDVIKYTLSLCFSPLFTIAFLDCNVLVELLW